MYQLLQRVGSSVGWYRTLSVSEESSVYAEIFERRRYINTPVQWARHPDLREYIHSAVTNLQPWVQQVSTL